MTNDNGEIYIFRNRVKICLKYFYIYLVISLPKIVLSKIFTNKSYAEFDFTQFMSIGFLCPTKDNRHI